MFLFNIGVHSLVDFPLIQLLPFSLCNNDFKFPNVADEQMWHMAVVDIATNLNHSRRKLSILRKLVPNLRTSMGISVFNKSRIHNLKYHKGTIQNIYKPNSWNIKITTVEANNLQK